VSRLNYTPSPACSPPLYPPACNHLSLSLSLGRRSLLVLGLKHFENTDFPKPLISQFLMPPKTYHQLSVRIKNLSVSRAPDNVIKVSEAGWGLCPTPPPPP